MPLPIRDGNQSLTTLSTILVSNSHIPAHTVVSLGTQAITDIATAVSGVELGPNTLNALENITVTLGQVTITGGLTDAQLRASAVTIGGVVTATISGTASVTFGTAVVTGSTSILNFPATQTVTFTQASVTFNNPIIATDNSGNSAVLRVDSGSGALRVSSSDTQVSGTVTANLSSSNLNSVTIGVRGTISAGISSYGTPPLFQVAVVSNGINTICASTVNFGVSSGLIDVASNPAGSLLLFNLTVNSASGAYKLETRTTDNTAGFDTPLTIFGTDVQTNTICQSGLYVMRRQAGDDAYYSRLRFTYLNGSGSFFAYKVSSVLDQYLGTSRPIYGSVTASISNSITIGSGTVTLGAGTAQIGSVTASISGTPSVTFGTAVITGSTSIIGTPSVTFGTAVVTGSTSILNFPATQTVTFSQAPVTFGLISGTVTASPTGTQTIAGTVTANAGDTSFFVSGLDVYAHRSVLYSSSGNGFDNDDGRPVDINNPLPISGTVTANLTQGINSSSLTSVDQTKAIAIQMFNEDGAILGGSNEPLKAYPSGLGNALAEYANNEGINYPLPISGTVTANTFALQGTAVTTSNFTSTTASTVLAGFNATREVLTIFNEGAGNLHICAGATCTTIAYQVRLSAGDYYEVPNHQTTITHSAVFATAGTARVTQVS